MGAQKKRAKKTNETKTVKSLLSHVVADDFFGTYATVIRLILQSNGKRPRETKEVLKTLYENMVTNAKRDTPDLITRNSELRGLASLREVV